MAGETARRAMPGMVRGAVILLAVAIALRIPIVLLGGFGVLGEEPLDSAIVDCLPSLLALGCLFAVVAARGWPRYGLIAVTVLEALTSAVVFAGPGTWVRDLVLFASFVLQIVAVALLFAPSARAWSSTRPRAKRPLSTMPAQWCPDPFGRHEYRWWDGERWTGSVASGGEVREEPVPAPSTGGR